MTEHDIQNSIRLELSKRGYFTERINVGGGYLLDNNLRKRIISVLRKHGEKELVKTLEKMHPFSTGAVKGRSDLSAIKDGQISFLEVKTDTGVASDDQIHFIDRMRELGCRAGIVRSVEDALELVGGFMNVDDKIEYWHTHETGNSLREFLGMSKEEYEIFISGN